jgi:ABC-type uncharacterized transport system substrate-binding protein
MKDVETLAGTIGLETVTLQIRQAEQIGPALESLNNRADALYFASDPLFNSNRVRINTVVLGLRLPTIYAFREYVEAGGLMSYGANFPALFRRGAEFVDKILHGTKPADISGRAANQIRSRHQSDDRKGARPHYSGAVARSLRRGDRVRAWITVAIRGAAD